MFSMVLSSFEQYELYLDTYPTSRKRTFLSPPLRPKFSSLYFDSCRLNLVLSVTDDSNGPYSNANLTLDIERTEDYGY